jgi:DNA-3-methyladenine glycosylase II
VQTIDTLEHLVWELESLILLDPRLAFAAKVAGELPLRRTVPGFASLASVIVSQQVSKASADAIFGRLLALDVLHDTGVFVTADHERLLGAGLSRPKLKTLMLAAAACESGGLDLHGLCRLPAHEAIASMTTLPGIGPWTAEVYLLFSAGHPDIFPAGDIALQNAYQMIFDLPERPTAKMLGTAAEIWSPHRGVASRLLWAYYGVKRGFGSKSPV